MKKFDRIYIEITNVCNVQCSFCPEVVRPKKNMGPEDFKKAIQKIKSHTDQVCLHLMGEPLAHPQIEEIFSICNEEKIFVNLTTNGLLLQRKIDILLKTIFLRQINISVQSYHDNFPEKSLEDYLSQMMKAFDLMRRERPEVYLNLRLWNHGVKNNENKLVFDFLEKYLNVEINRNVEPKLIKSKKLVDRLYLHFDSRFDWPNMSAPYLGEVGKCHALTHHIGIHADGTIVPCCLDKEAVINLGNIFNSELDEVLKSERVIKMKQGFLDKKLVEKLCQHCGYIKRFQKKSMELEA